MDAILQQLTSVQGVTGAALFNKQGGCVAHVLHPPYEPILLVEAVQELRQAVEMFTYLDSTDFQGFVAHLDSGKVVARQTGEWLVFVLGDDALQTSMLNVALSVVVLKLKAAGAPPEAPASVAVGSMSLGSMGTDGSIGTMVETPTDAVGVKVMKALLKELASQLGPFAKVLLKQELGKLGLSARTVGRQHFDDLVKVLSKRIPEEDKRQDFVSRAKQLPDA